MSTTARDIEVRVVQPRQSEEDLVRPVSADAREEEIVAATCSCVVHLCGCKG